MKTFRTTTLTLIFVSLSALVFLSSCSKLKDDLPVATPAGIAVHPDGWKTKTDSVNFHGVAIRGSNWDMRSCRTCHGSTYTGGSSGTSCYSCHTGFGGPEGCAVCHGTPGVNAAPPRDLSRQTSTSARGVGAHQIHYVGGTLGANALCSECHILPTNVYDQGHIDASTPGRAEVVLNTLIGKVASGSPSYDLQTLKCNNTFCHGNWSVDSLSSSYKFVYSSSKMTGANFAPVWNGGSSQGACGTCHGNPPTGHTASTLSTCGSCHWKVAQFDIINNTGKIVDKVNHMNGRVNVFGAERSF